MHYVIVGGKFENYMITRKNFIHLQVNDTLFAEQFVKYLK